MAKLTRTQARVLSGTADTNLRFEDVRQLLFGLGFSERVRGDHHIYTRPGLSEIINLQPREGGLAKPYQVRQVRGLIVKYRLQITEEG